IAQTRHGELARQIAQFREERAASGITVAEARPATVAQPAAAVASLSSRIVPASPSLVERPELVTARLSQRVALPMAPSAGDRARLAELASLALDVPRLLVGPAPARRSIAPPLPSLAGGSLPLPPDAIGAASPSPSAPERQVASLGPSLAPSASLTDSGRFSWGGWVPAPAFDEEHPEELSYRPFPIVPYLTDAPSQPLMGELVLVDVARTVEMLDQLETSATLRFRPTAQAAGALWAQQFSGAAVVGIDREREGAGVPAAAGSVLSRAVRTSQR
ncbi:MAG: hypothetical protein AB7O57_19985, partial [Hyphomicrobiaceae bacterium]